MKHQIQKERISLTLLYAGITFCVQLITVLVAGLLAYLLTKLGLLKGYGVSEDAGAVLLMLMALISAVVGIAVTLLTRRIPLNPFNRLINNMNRLAEGDFRARLEFGAPIRNHSAFRELSDSFNTMARELENTEMLRRDFINNFSHEFKTPIVSIAGFAKLLRRGGKLTQEQQQEYLAIIEEEALRLSSMASNVLMLTKVENQTILTDVSVFNLSEQLRSCVLLLEEYWTRKELDLDLEFDEYEIAANEELLMQVWINLLDNAMKFSPPTGEIVLRVQQVDEMLRVRITNFGSEIPPDKQDKIWNKFYQADESHASAGNGVGLAVVKYIVELHGGTVRAESENDWTAFEVTLPQRRPE